MTDSIEDSINTVVTSYNDLNNVLEQLKAGELFQELDLSQYATKTELGNYASKSDLSNYVSSSVLNQYVTNNDLKNEIGNYQLPLSPDSNNLLRRTDNGYLVELQAAPDVSNQYVSSSKGSDTSGDGSANNPFKTIYKALSRIPDNTAVAIYLWYEDTFNFWDGRTPAYTGNENWGDLMSFSWNAGRRTIYFNSWGYPAIDNPPTGVTTNAIEAPSKPVIQFRYSVPSDTGLVQCPGIFVNNAFLNFTQITIRVLPDNLPSHITEAYWSAPIGLQNGETKFNGCRFELANAPVFGADGGNTSAGSIVTDSFTWFDTTNGPAFADGSAGYTVNLSFGDVTPGASIIVNGKDTGLKQQGGNPSVIENSRSFVNLSVINQATRTYAGLKTQNNIGV